MNITRTIRTLSRMTPGEFRAIGEALYDADWRDHIAKDLGIAKGTVDQFASGHRRIRPINALAIRYLQIVRQAYR